MNEFSPRGHISIREALNRVGRELFGSDWTGEERKARRGLIGKDEWLKIKDVPPPRGSGATGSGSMFQTPPVAARPHSITDPSNPSYQAEFRARERYVAARHRIRVMLEAGDLEAAILDTWTGDLHRGSAALWRRHDAERMIDRERAPLPRGADMGSLWIKDFAEVGVRCKPLPAAKKRDLIRALQEKGAAERLTRPQQKDFLRKTFPAYRITERQFGEIFREVTVPTGRPKKSDKKG
jgi:hypothetical protein